MGDVIDFQKRRLARKTVDFPISVQVGGCLLTGRARDYTPLGLFFEPAESCVDGRLVCGEEALEALGPDSGDRATVTIFDSQDRPVAETTAEVRWVGYSDTHRCRGLGMQLHAVADEREAA